MAAEVVHVEGLREFQASLRKMDGQSQKQLRLVLNDSVEVVASGARALMPSRSGRARASVKAQSSQREARVAIGGSRAPYVPWLDFGGSVGRNDSVKRPFIKEGRYLYPTLERRRSWFTTRLEKGLTDLVRSSGLDPS